MKQINILIFGFILFTSLGCKKYLDVNDNPNGPSTADPALYLPSIQTNYAAGIQFDARALGSVTQNFLNSSIGNTAGVFEIHGFLRGSDFSGDLWRNVYWKGGQNTLDLINNARAQKKWDILGVGIALQAWGWQMLTDYHGEIILKEAFDPLKNTFNYDTQDTVYAHVKRQCFEAISELEKSSDAVGSPLFPRFDLIYKGDRAKWRKFCYGLLAINAHHLIKKSSYKPDEVISYVNQALSSNADDAIVPFAGTSTADASFFGTRRQNFGFFGQSSFIVRLTDGTVFTGAKDPRQLIMLSPSTDGMYRGLNPTAGQSSTISASATGVKNLYGTNLGTNPALGTATGRYVFQDNGGFPLMTYAQLQFIKAEAAFVKGDKATALAAYSEGVNKSLDFVRSYSTDPVVIANYNATRTTFLANQSVIPTSSAALTINQILLQKYIALWGWGFIETWTDLRKFDYDPAIFTSFTPPPVLSADNNGKLMYRVRPRYNSEYIWNIDALTKIGGFETDFHTKKMWIQLP
jgi:hypothetical protein